ncbi:MAG: biopolymer transporter Tol [Ignavibacteria bacterium]|nr:biopolymer transporter Tol [Ignavibacteria bacterium]
MNIKGLIFLLITSFVLNSFYLLAQFGKNKVQYQKFEWRYIQSKHFDIYFHDKNKVLATFTALIAEKSIESIQKTLKYKITRRIPIIVYNSHNQFQQTNVVDLYLPEGVGGFTELFKNRVVLPFEGNYSQFRHVIHHELVHAVLNDMFYGGTIQSAISRGNTVEIPIWMNEGLCEWESIGGLDVNTDVYIRDLTLNESLPNLSQLDGYNAYRGGQVFWWYVSERYGTHKIPELLSKLKSTGSVESAFRNTFNLKLDDFSEEWKRFLKKFYFPDIEKFSYPDDFSLRLTDHKKKGNFYNTSPSLSPQGNKIAFIADKNGLFSLYIMDLDNKNQVTEIVSSFRQQDFEELNVLTPGISWSPDGKQLAISAKFEGEDIIYLVNVETKKYERLRLGFHQISSVAWSPKGNFLAFSGTILDRRDIFIYNLNSKTLTRLTNDIFYDDFPIWSKDGKHIYFISEREGFLNTDENELSVKPWNINFGTRDIYSLNLESKQISRITETPQFNKTSLALSSDNKFLYFVANDNGIGNIYRLNLSTKKYVPITNSLSNIMQVTHSEVGDNLVFSALTQGGFNLFLLKNPSLVDLKRDTLPLTKLRFGELEAKKKAESEQAIVEEPSDTMQIDVSYGNFVVDFSRQSHIKPNRDLSANQFQSTFQMPNDTNFVDYEYKLTLTPDIILGNPYYSSFWGFQGLAQMLFSDILGDHQIYVAANLWLDLKNSNFYVQYSYLPNIIDYRFLLYQSTLFYSTSFGSQFSSIYRLRNYGAGVSASYPLSLFNRFEFNLLFFNVSRENTTDLNDPTISRTLLFPEIRYVYDDVIYGSFAPVNGTRWYASFQAVPKIFANSLNFYTVKFDYRRYWDFGYFLKLAFRTAGGASFGTNSQRFFLGGLDNWINYSINNRNFLFENPEDFAFMELITPLRGWNYSEQVGTRFFITNIELRFPLFTALLPGPIPIVFNDILGVIFMDLAGAWSGAPSNFKFSPPKVSNEGFVLENGRILLSLGVGARAWILGLPFKFDVAWKKYYENWSKPTYLFSIDYDF